MITPPKALIANMIAITNAINLAVFCLFINFPYFSLFFLSFTYFYLLGFSLVFIVHNIKHLYSLYLNCNIIVANMHLHAE